MRYAVALICIGGDGRGVVEHWRSVDQRCYGLALNRVAENCAAKAGKGEAEIGYGNALNVTDNQGTDKQRQGRD